MNDNRRWNNIRRRSKQERNQSRQKTLEQKDNKRQPKQNKLYQPTIMTKLEFGLKPHKYHENTQVLPIGNPLPPGKGSVL